MFSFPVDQDDWLVTLSRKKILTDSDNSSNDFEYDKMRSPRRRRPGSIRKKPLSDSSSTPSDNTSSDDSQETYQLKREETSEAAPSSDSSSGSTSRPVKRRVRDPKYVVKPRYRSATDQKGGILAKYKKTGEARRTQRSRRSDSGNAWRGEWIQMRRLWWRFRKFLDARYAPVEEQNEKIIPAFKTTQKEKLKPLVVVPASLKRFHTEDLAWKIAATAGTIGLVLLLLVKLMPAQMEEVPVSSIDVIDTRSELPVRAEKPKDGSLPYEIVLDEPIDFPTVVTLTEEPEKPEEPVEEVVEILPDVEPEPEIKLSFVRIPLEGPFAQYLEVPEEEPELFAETAVPENVPENFAVTDSDVNGSVIENTSAVVISEDSWDEYQEIVRTDDIREEDYHGGLPQASEIHSKNHVPEEFKRTPDGSTPIRTVNVSIEKIVPREKALGNVQEYSILIKNLSSQRIDEVDVTEMIPSGMKVVDVNPTASYEKGELNWKITELEPGSLQELKIQYRGIREGLIQSVAYVQPVIAVASESEIQSARPKLHLAMQTPPATPVGERYQVRYRVTNMSEEEVHDLILATDLPDKIDHQKGRKLKYEIGTLQAGESKEIVLKAFATRPGQGVQSAFLNSEYGESSSVEQYVRVIPVSRQTITPKKEKVSTQPATPAPNCCCCWKVSLHP